VVAAVSEEIAEEALDLIEDEYEELPAAFTVEQALAPGFPPIHDKDSNIVVDPITVKRGDVERGFREADVIVEGTYEMGRPTPAYMEPNVCVSKWDEDRLTMWISTQTPFMVRGSLAEVLGLPHVAVVVLIAGGTVDRRALAAELDGTRAAFGLPPDPESAMPHRRLILEPAPAGFRDPADPLPAQARRIRPAVVEADPPPIPADASTARTLAWLDGRPVRPVVWFTLGTIFHQESGDLFTRAMVGLGRLHASVVITVGREVDPAELGPPPANVLVERFVPQQVLLPRCDLLVCHAGSGSVLGALAFGVPMLLLPMGADQPANADRSVALGVAMALDPLTATPGDVASAARELLTDPRFGRAAEPFRRACAALPTADDAVGWIRTHCSHPSGS